MLGGLTRTLLLSIAVLAFGFAPASMHGFAQADDLHTDAAPIGAVTTMPYGWADFCGRHADECRVDALQPVDIVLTAKIMRTLRRVNGSVNAAIEPVSNLDHWGTMLDHWDYPTDGKGDCKIYALQKRKMLIEMGFPRQALLMTIVRDQEDNGHTILTVKTDKGDFILDNMVEDIRPWDATGYKFVKRQSQSDPNVWVSIGTSSAPRTTAVATTASRALN
ncbi:MAG: transglutaminase-like cysteine peptidase [Beijerinckiaceae bacterium]|nr:transglutaminase-like cysteine peptidase [Beijerinckiaceae bacterium]